MEENLKLLVKFIYTITQYLKINLSIKNIESEIRKNFSFYFYHYLSCQLVWTHWWQIKIKDLDLIFITLQALIPSLKNKSNRSVLKKIELDDFYKVVGNPNKETNDAKNSVNASSIAEICGIPRATCMRKLDKLVTLGILVREIKTKRYYINKVSSDRTKIIMKKENIDFTVNSFSNFLAIVISALTGRKDLKYF